jgi:hypothetical protein
MRLVHPRPVAAALVAGGVLLAAVSELSLAAEAISAAPLPSQQSCEPLQLPPPSSSPSATPTPTTTASTTPAPVVSLCVAVKARQASAERGKPARWTVSAWATGATVPAATIELQTSPADAGTPKFTFGCGTANGTASCPLGAVDPQSARRQFRAQLTVPVTATDVTSVTLTVIGTAADLPEPVKAAVAVAITEPPAPATTPPTTPTPDTTPTPETTPPTPTTEPATTPAPPPPTDTQPAPATQPAAPTDTQPPPPAPVTAPPQPPPPITVTSPLPVGSLPNLPPAASPPYLPPVGPVPVPTQTQSGNAAGLFPPLSPSPTPDSTSESGTRKAGNATALPEGASVVGAQLAGLAALALAFVFAVTRVSVRRPAKQAAPDDPADSGPGTEGSHDVPGA